MFGTRQRSHSYVDVQSVSAVESVIPLADDIKILGMTLDKNLSMDKHVGAVCKASYYHLRSLRHIRRLLTDDMAKAIGCAIVGAMLDYANSVLQGISQYNIQTDCSEFKICWPAL